MSITRFYGLTRFLSNFYPVEIEYEGITYPSVEHAFQAAKTLNAEFRKQFLLQDISAGDAKRMGQKLELRKDWENVKIEVMRHLVRKKFTENEALKHKLLGTGDETLSKGNYWQDTFWGVDLSVRPAKGQNHLGKILMEVRKELQ